VSSNKLIFGVLVFISAILLIPSISNQNAYAGMPQFDVTECGVLNVEGAAYFIAVPVINFEGTCLTVTANNILIEGPGTLNGFCTSHDTEDIGIHLQGVAGVTIDNIKIINADTGIFLENSNGNTIQNSETSNSCSNGIHLDPSNNNLIRDNTITFNDLNGIFVEMSTGNTIVDNFLDFNSGDGTPGTTGQINLENSDVNGITRNTLERGEDHGIRLFNSESNLIDDNILTDQDDDAIIVTTKGGSSDGNFIINNTVFQEPFSEDGIDIEGASFNTVTGNTLDGGYNDGGEEECDGDSTDGIEMSNSNNNIVNDNIVRNWGEEGVNLRDVSFSNFARNEVHHNCEDGFDLDDADDSDIGSDNNTFTDNNVHDNDDDGFDLDDHADNNTIEGNQVTNNGEIGISLEDESDGNIITGNTVLDNRDEGIQLEDSHNNIFTLNTISGSFDSGIDIEDHSTGNTFSCNTITTNDDTGIEIENHSHQNKIFKNQIEGNFAGLGFWTSAHDNEIIHNNIVSNEVQIFVGTDGTPEENILSPNFWGDDVPQEHDSSPLDSPVELINCESKALPETDSDDDGIPDLLDNCPDDANEDQLDSDNDRAGDVCDAFPFDFDNDSIDDEEDNCPFTPNPDQADADGDGVGDVCERRSSGGDNQWDTRPTSGLNYENYEQFVNDGIGVNGNFWTINNDFYQPTDKKELKIGETTTLTIKVYATKVLWKQVFGLSVEDIGSNNAEVELETTLNRDGSLDGIEVIQNTEVVDPETISVSSRMVNCSDADTENLCNEIEVQFTLQEKLEHLTGYSQSIDFERRADQIWYN
jgi:parallel beta-helix repeat protein